MTLIRLVRHAEPREAVGVDPDLTSTGLDQAAALVPILRPCALVTSPMKRARSTARALERAWGAGATVEDAVRELPSPASTNVDRREWLNQALRSTFAQLDDEHRRWRDGILSYLRSITADTVIVTHAIVINAAVGHCIGDDRVWHMRPAHASVTTLQVDRSRELTVVERGTQIDSIVT